jgi:DNA-binding transcriptional ArsR family regulator
MTGGDGDGPDVGAPGGAPDIDDVPPRNVRDPRVLRALAHPVRIALLELLIGSGPHTATEAGARLGETPANASFHLRTLARYGLVEEVPGGRRGRQRPWQATVSGVQIDTVEDDAEFDLATGELAHVVLMREADRLREWFARRSAESREWRDAPFMSGSRILYVTPAELREVDRVLTEALDRYRGRANHPDRRPPGARAVSFLALTVPRDEPPAAEADVATVPEGD